MDWASVGSFIAGAICFAAGVLAWTKAPKSTPAAVFLAAMVAVLFAMTTSQLYLLVGPEHADVATIIAKVFMVSALLAIASLWILTLLFPVERVVSFWRPNLAGAIIVVTVIAMIVIGLTTELDYTTPDPPSIDTRTSLIVAATTLSLAALTTASAAYSMTKADRQGKKSALILLAGYWIFMVSSSVWVLQVASVGPFSRISSDVSDISMIIGVAGSGLLFATAIEAGQMTIKRPTSERLVSSSKAKFKLLHRYVYLVEEPKPDFAFKMFSDILKGRCFDCENDESFPCESLDCSTCMLPCPCRECTKYKSRPQGLIVTRQFPKDVRSKYYLQTTPILWLSTVAGPDNMDPAKLSLLTDYLVNFMEKSQNGVIMVDGLEYLITSNDFQRVLRAVDRCTESAMVSSSRLIMTVDPRSFDPKELATLERNREVVRPDATETWRIIPERL